jgi:hypothetical protein
MGCGCANKQNRTTTPVVSTRRSTSSAKIKPIKVKRKIGNKKVIHKVKLIKKVI